MAFVQTIHLAHLPPEYSVYIGLFTDVQNAAFLRQQLLAGNRAFEFAFIDASMVLSTTHLLAAVYRALNDMIHDRLQSHNVHSEIVFALGSTNNISTTLRTFGITSTSNAIIAVKVGGPPSDPAPTSSANSSTLASSLKAVQLHLDSHVQGTPVALTDEALSQFTDIVGIRKAYKLGPAAKGAAKSAGTKGLVKGAKNPAKDSISAEERTELAIAAMGVMALRGS